MKPPIVLLLLCLGVLLCGCSMGPQTPVMATAEYAAKAPITGSLFPSDQAVLSDEAVRQILSSKLELPARAKVALMRFPEAETTRYGVYYWRDEEYLKLQQAHMDAMTQALLASDRVAEVTPLPSLMTPTHVALPILREAAVRMQADLLLVFRINSDTYSQYRLFAKDKVKSYSTCELVLLDVRTGLVPFTRVVSREQVELKQSSDLELTETMHRAEQGSAAASLKAAAEDLVAFMKTVSGKK